MARGRPSLRKRQAEAGKARARMAKRAKRARFFKEQKKNIMLVSIFAVLLVLAGLFTPFGPEWYYNKIQANKFESRGVISPGSLEKLYKLGTFYGWTLRKDAAMKVYDEIAEAYYGFTFSEFAVNADHSWDKQFAREKDIARGIIAGPPYKIDDSDLPFVGLALHDAAFIVKDSGRSRAFARRLFQDLYMDDFYANNPQACDERTTTIMRNTANVISGR